ncbi:MAG: tRNA (adenosine(37)-N6)-dimethylallyltransferase MiaA [Chitinophagales bacterium]
MQHPGKYLIVIAGPTGIGKTNVAIQLAQHFQTEIISADARQLYKEMRIGTAVPTDAQLQAVPHHCVHNLSIHDAYSVGQYEVDVLQLLEKLFTQHHGIILTGGSGLYIHAVMHGLDALPPSDPIIRKQLQEAFEQQGITYLQEKLKEADPDYLNRVDKNNPHRLMRALEVFAVSGKPYSTFRRQQTAARHFTPIKICLNTERNILYERINQRVIQMIEAGLFKEAKALYPFRHLNALQTVGYQELFEYFEDKISLEEAIHKIQQNTRNYAKRQLTWFRKDTGYKWFVPEDLEGMVQYIKEQMQ